MWRDCFDKHGHFSRAQFNGYLPLLSQWDGAFYLMWLDLKSVDIKEDRTSIITSLVRFVKDSPFVDQYIDFILKDFSYYPLHLHYSDTNALIFTNLLLFKNYAQRDYYFERTPEEVLISKEEKNTKLIERLSGLIANQWGERFSEKVRTIKKNLQIALGPEKNKTAALPANALINMLREAMIFLTLVGGKAVGKMVRDMVSELGNPDFKLYHLKNSNSYQKNLLQLLQVGIRCLMLLGDRKDIELLQEIRGREEAFVALKGILDLDLSYHQKIIKKIMTVADEAMAALQSPGASVLR